ncbi:MAG TPA: MBL fold metallo-hydrolase [Stellaceae bacterium]|nr:MBL fold metallo-hydrolase [Stellaceae bacterium]
MRLTFLGCGDAFGSGGRFNTCFHVTGATTEFLIDCGASSLIAMRKFGVDPNGIASIFITHLHGDHFGGLPFFILDAQLVSRRTAPLTVAGPPGLIERLRVTMEAFFPGSTAIERKFAVEIVELAPSVRREIGGVTVTPYPVRHACGAPPYALRLECDGKVVAYTGDTEWTETLIPAARDADLFIAEAYFHDKPIRHHLDWRSLAPHLDTIRPKRLILTHFSPDMLARAATLPVEAAEDGKVVEIA